MAAGLFGRGSGAPPARTKGTREDPIDQELEHLLRKLSRIQKEVGVKPTSSAPEARELTGDRFVDLKLSMVDRVAEVRAQLADSAKDGGGGNPRAQIQLDANIKRGLRDLEGDWQDLEKLVKAETRKKGSQLSEEERLSREELVVNLLSEIDELKSAHRAGYAPTAAKDVLGEGLPNPLVPTMAQSELFAAVPEGKERGLVSRRADEQEAISEDQRQRMAVIERRDQEFDDQIAGINEGIDVLADIARAQHREVKKQDAMIEDLSNKVDTVQEHLENVNSKMKKTLDNVTRSSDKICVDIMCLLLLVGMIVVLYQLTTDENVTAHGDHRGGAALLGEGGTAAAPCPVSSPVYVGGRRSPCPKYVRTPGFVQIA
eukprot:CAMPEP_0185688928 /NCGR_PEP_ID=MMETSP1164-20130828/140_1 /TAXON_ID=1104430 /ORGANISM="Chrysoreinhardia sp, Strain CCMP2950" /LENGTH=372 /DNA_ID=CAMNT_0028355401 /DNA_START=18 /DNA_END=1134 /DNA_ORIENTATION=-